MPQLGRGDMTAIMLGVTNRIQKEVQRTALEQQIDSQRRAVEPARRARSLRVSRLPFPQKPL
jgi:hypothetical protein